MLLTDTEVQEYRSLLTEVNRMAMVDLVSLWRTYQDLDRDMFFRLMLEGTAEIAEMYRATAAETALLFYEETQGLAFSSVEAASASAVVMDQFDSRVRWAMFAPGNTDRLGLVSGIVKKTVVDGARDYGLSSIGAEGQRWVRAARPSACPFCRMLATRDAVYTSAEAAVSVGGGKRRRKGKQQLGSKFHDHCMCIPVVESAYEKPDHVEAWTEQYNEAYKRVGGSNLQEIVKQMRIIDNE